MAPPAMMTGFCTPLLPAPIPRNVSFSELHDTMHDTVANETSNPSWGSLLISANLILRALTAIMI